MAGTPRRKTRTPVPRAADSVNRVYAAIQRMAVNFEFRPEQRINEVELAAHLKVSRTPVREALNRLVIEGLITLVPNKGFFCRPFDAEQIMSLFEVRAALERLAVELAAERADDAGIDALIAFWTEVRAHGGAMTPDELTDRDEAFHIRIAQLAGNPEVVRMLEGINARIRFVRRIEIENPSRRATTFDEHLAIAEALKARDRELAVRRMSEHIAVSVSDAVAAMKEGLARIYMGRMAS